MDSGKTAEKMLADEEISVIDYLCMAADEEYARAREEGADFLRGLEAEAALWHKARDAQKEGKKLVLYTGPVPLELLRASGCVPMSLDYAQIRLARASAHTRKLIYAAEMILPECFCSMDKSMLGMADLKRLGMTPDAFIYASSECDASKMAYPFVDRALGVRSFQFDIPAQKTDASLEYIVRQLESMEGFLENVSGQKPDAEELAVCVSRTNRSYGLLEKCAGLRRNMPCPLPGRLLTGNGYAGAMACLPETVAFLEEELEIGTAAAKSGKSPCRDGEKHRAAFIQNMLWSSGNITDWLEREYGCACVMDAFGLAPNRYFEHPDDRHDCLTAMADRMRGRPSLHGVSWSAERLWELIDRLFEEYRPDVSIFAGHIGCRHTWATVRMISESIQEKYGIPTLELPVDGINMEYKPEDEILQELAEYMDTVVHK